MPTPLATHKPRLIARQLSIIYFALLTGQVAFGAVLYFVTSPGSLEVEPGLRTTLLIVVTAVALVSVAIMTVLYSARLESIRKQSDPAVKMRSYITLSIVRYAAYEAPTLVALAGYSITSSALFLGIAVLLLALFITIRPTSAKFSSDLGIQL